jgi:hypothetical protein
MINFLTDDCYHLTTTDIKHYILHAVFQYYNKNLSHLFRYIYVVHFVSHFHNVNVCILSQNL